ncbi:MAG: glycosyltransferase family 2 protein [Candidatus Promineifilaceae bacterium]
MAPLAIPAERIMALIPAYNEEGAIASVIEGVRRELPQADIVVIDDCSTDRTSAVARAAGAEVVRIPYNLGIGGAVQTGLKFAREHNYDIVIRLDGDGQHDPAEIPMLFAAVKSGRADAVFGSRFIDNDSTMTIPISRRAGIKTFAFLVTILTGQKATDTTSGFMGANKYAIDILADYLPQDYPEVEGRIILHKAGLTTLELPARMRSRMAGISSINSWRSMYYAVKVSIAALIGAMKDIPVVRKELDYDSNTAYPKTGRYRGQPYSAVSDHPSDTEAQTT